LEGSGAVNNPHHLLFLAAVAAKPAEGFSAAEGHSNIDRAEGLIVRIDALGRVGFKRCRHIGDSHE